MAASPDLFLTSERSAVETLRASTVDIHRTLEAMPLMQRIASGRIGIDDYRAFLRAQLTVMERWWAICPVCVANAAPETVDARSAGLRQDLAALGGDATSISLLWPRHRWPSYSPQWWGALYVIEGSRLGACALADRIEQALGARVAHAMRFLHGRHDARAGWSRLSERIDQRIGARVDDAIVGARAAYGWYAQCFALAMLERETEAEAA